MVGIYGPSVLRANVLLKQNIDALLKRRGFLRKDLAQYCRRTEGWLSKIFRDESKGLPLKYLDRIADFFGLATYQLFQPGIASSAERRKKVNRRVGGDRRVANRQEMVLRTGDSLRQTQLEAPQIDTHAGPIPSAARLAHIAAQLAKLTAQLAEHADADPGAEPDRSVPSARPDKTAGR